MESGWPADEVAGRIRQAADAALRDPRFVRSPVLSRLLAFLVQKSLSGEKVNAFTIAMDGLGRTSINLSEAETYARVAAARLRRTLAQVYAANPEVERLIVEAGTYTVRLEALAMVANSRKTPTPQPHVASVVPRTSKRWPAEMQLVVAIGIAIIVLVIAMYVWPSVREQEKWQTFDLPKVSVTFQESVLPPAEAEQYRQMHLGSLSAYVGMSVIDGAASAADFKLKIFPVRQSATGDMLIVLEDVRIGRIVWSTTKRVHDAGSHKALADSIAATIASPNGILHSYARRQGYKADSPYGCWLRFTESVQAYNTIGDDDLEGCARKWYSAAPERPLAAFLHGWTLTDRSITELRASQRKEFLQQAIKVIHQAQTRNPDFAVLHIAEMRAHSFRGDRKRAITAAQKAIRTARNNRLVIGMAASGMATWNDPRGAEVLRELRSDSEVTFPWEHVGLFVAAMMADDVAEAGRQLEQLEVYEAGQPLLTLVSAAYAGRIGDREGVESALERLGTNPFTSVARRETVINRLPVAPEVRSTLRAWIGGSVSR